ncbi:MAG: hypothetical protein RJA10_2721, partial [Pseudomonadota bacterium]
EAEAAAAQTAARFRNEAQAAGRLLHPGIVGVYDFGDDGRVSYIAMEYVEGHTLSHYLAQRVRFSEADIASVAWQLLDALAHAHEHGVWHRDIKPSNVIMTKAGRIKIADFGIARTDTTGLTMANSVLGTPMYMAPEQFMGKPIDHRVDVYSTGVVLYQMVAGRPPFTGPHEALMYKVVNERAAPPSTLEGAQAGPCFDDIVALALAKAPGERFPNASAFRDAVATALGAMVPMSVSRDTVFALPMPTEYVPTERIAGAPPPTTAAPPTHWDPSVLQQVEHALARHVGPLAAVLVRRAAKECHDLPTLQARLAEQITNAEARDAFLGHNTKGSGRGATAGSAGGTVRTAGSGAATGRVGTNVMPGVGGTFAGAAPPVNEALMEQAQKLLAAHLGPIARVVVRRAAERTRQREGFYSILAEAAPPAVRDQLLAQLHALP